MKKLGIFFAALCCVLIASGSARAQLFQQNFESSTSLATYQSATPNNGQFNTISTSGAGTTVSINTVSGNNVLEYTRTGANAGSFSRTTDFSPVPTTLKYQFDLTVTGNTVATTSAAVFQVGSGFGTANSAESNANTYARFAINLSATNGNFSIRDITNGTSSAEFSGAQTITWILNNSGSSLSYSAPDSTMQSVNNDTADIYVGNTLIFDNVAVQTPAQTITDLKFVYSGGSGTIRLDNFLISPLAPTAASVSVSGRVTDSYGKGIGRATITLLDVNTSQTRTAQTGGNGYYVFEDVPVGGFYVVNAVARRYTFAQDTQSFTLIDAMQGVNFTATR